MWTAVRTPGSLDLAIGAVVGAIAGDAQLECAIRASVGALAANGSSLIALDCVRWKGA